MESSSHGSIRSRAAAAFFPLLVFRHFVPAMTPYYHAVLPFDEKLLVASFSLNLAPLLSSEAVDFDNVRLFWQVIAHL